MQVHLIVAHDKGPPSSLVINAASADAARAQAETQGYVVLAIKPVGTVALWQSLSQWVESTVGRLSNVDVFPEKSRHWNVEVFVEQLRDLLQAGLSVVEALDTLERGIHDVRALSVVRQLRQGLYQGLSLSAAMADQRNFPSLLIALVRASELTSDLPQCLTRFIDHEQRVAEIRHKVTSTALYPAILTGVGGSVLLFLLFYVMPRFARIFESLSGELPWSARAMVGWSKLLASNQMIIMGALMTLFAGIVTVVVVPTIRTRLFYRLLQWRVFQAIRDQVNAYYLARWYRGVGMLVLGGIPMLQALQLAFDLLPVNLQERGKAVEAAVNQGMSPSMAYVQAGMATPVAEQLLKAAERTGDLGAVLERVALFHENEVRRSLERSMKVMEPLIMLFIGMGVGVVVVLMYMPIFELASSIP